MNTNFKILHFDSLDSTNNYANGLVDVFKAEDRMIIWTRNQFAGRGQTGNTWISEADKCLTFSMILYPQNILIKDQFYLLIAISLGIVSYLENKTQNVSIKWPNDIYVKDHKIGGILIENSVMKDRIYHATIGIGINFNQDSFNNNLPNPVSLKQLTSKEYSIEDELNTILNFINNYLNDIDNKDFDKLTVLYKKYLYQFGQWHWYVSKDRKFEAKIIDVKPTGELGLEDRTGEVRYFLFKEVGYLIR